jgi:hypothetical protein
MKSKKVIAGVLSLSILSLSSATAFAAGSQEVRPISALEPVKISQPINGTSKEPVKSYFNFFAGTVKEIKDYKPVEGSKIILVESEGGELANIIVSKSTYVLNNAEIRVGSSITGYYKADAPMIMIYPIQFSAEVAVVDYKEQIVKVDVFSKDLISADGFLKLNVSDETEIVSKDGKAFKGELANRKLVVIYATSTKSIPSQTNPIKIVVLSDDSIKDTTEKDEKAKAAEAIANRLKARKAALRAIAESFGFDENWNSIVVKVRK